MRNFNHRTPRFLWNGKPRYQGDISAQSLYQPSLWDMGPEDDAPPKKIARAVLTRNPRTLRLGDDSGQTVSTSDE